MCPRDRCHSSKDELGNNVQVWNADAIIKDYSLRLTTHI